MLQLTESNVVIIQLIPFRVSELIGAFFAVH